MAGKTRETSRHQGGVTLLVSCLLLFPLALTAQDSTSLAPDLGLDSLLTTPVSTAAKYSQDVRQVAGSVSIVTREDIRRFGYRTLLDVLNTMAGVYTSNPRAYESVGIRGFGRPTDYNNRILLLFDGHPVFESMWGQASLGDDQSINMDAVERIELIRGPASALYGTGAMLGVINVISREGRNLQSSRATFEAGSLGRRGGSVVLGTSFGSSGSVLLSGLYEDVDGQENLYYPEYDDPSTNNGIAHGLDGMRRGSARLALRLGSFSLRARYNRRERADPTASFGTLFNTDNRLVDASGFLELTQTADLSERHQLSSRVYYDEYRYEGDYPYATYVWREQSRNRVIGFESALRWDLGSRNRLTTGVEYRRNFEVRYDSPDDATFDYGDPFSVVSTYLQDEHQLLPNLTLLAGIRHDDHEISGGATTPRAAILFDPRQGTTLKLMAGSAFRAPTIYETEFKASSVAGSLNAERLQMLEMLWLERLSSRLLLTSSIFYYQVDDLIDTIQDSTSTDQLAYVNRDEVKARGLEVTVDARPSHATRAYLNYTYQHALDGEDAGLSNSPAHLMKGGVALDLAEGITSAFELRYESKRKTVYDTYTDAFALVNANVRIHPFGVATPTGGILRKLELGLRVENLLNTRYSYPGGTEHLQPSIEQNGRTFIVRVTSSF
jgi:outer membrane receptor for ferrienterochelin and colicins